MYMNGPPGPLLVFILYIISISQMDVGGGPAAVVGGGAAPAAVPATGYFLLLRKNFSLCRCSSWGESSCLSQGP